MALITCPACGKPVSKNAPACPSCGEPIKSSVEKASGAINIKDPIHIIGILIAILMVVGIVLYIMV